MGNKKKLAIVISHVIQHFIPQYENWSNDKDWEIKVFFGTRAGTEKYYDNQFKMEIKWDVSQLDHFDHTFIKNTNKHPDEHFDSGIIESNLEHFNPDFILIYGYSQTLQRKSKSWALRNGVKIIYFSDSELRHSRNILKVIFKKIWLTQYFKDISYFLTTGNSNEEYLLNYNILSNKIIRSSYPIDISLYEEKWNIKDKLRYDIRRNLNIREPEIIISMVGKFVPWKRQIDIIKALILLDKDSSLKLKLILIGTGELEEELKHEAKKLNNHSVIYIGFVAPTELPALYAATDIYIHSSEIEPHSVAISEAIYMGCPIVLSDKCGSYGTHDDVQLGINGFTYECGNIEKLASIILNLSHNSELRESFSFNSHRIADHNQKISHFHTLRTLKILNENMI